jgi:tetratricopeptide (TPR) repeat protein
MTYEEKLIKGKINQVISDIKKIAENKAFHFALADELDSGKLPMYNLLDVHPESASLGYFSSLSPENQQKIIQSPELDENEWKTFREYWDFMERRGITAKLVHSYPGLFPDALLRHTYHCFISFFQQGEKLFLRRKFKGESLEKEIDPAELEKIGSAYRHLEKNKPFADDADFKQPGQRLFCLFLEDRFIVDGLKRIYIDIPVEINDPKNRRVLEDLPFEILYSEKYHFLVTQRRIPVIRIYADAPAPAIPATEPFRFPFKLLVIISNPPGLVGSSPINVERQKRIFYKTLDPWVYEGKLEIDVIDIATLDNIAGKLARHQFDAVHFLGHGFEEGILLESADAGGESVYCAQFASLFAGSSIRWFFLTSCLTGAETVGNRYSSTVRELRKVGVPVVVGMRYPLTFTAAEILVAEFYQGVFQAPEQSLLEVYTRALNKVSLERDPQVSANAFIPVIYMPVDYDAVPHPGTKEINQKLLEVQEPFLEKVPGRRRQSKLEFLGGLRNHTTGCYGREDDVRRAKKALQNPNHRILIVKGFGGIGKSAFIYRLLRDLYSEYDGFFVKEFRMEAEDRDYTIDHFFRELDGCLERGGDTGLRQLLAGENGAYDIPAVLKYIAGAVERLRMLVVLDNLEQLLERGQDGKFRFKDECFLHLVEEVMKAASGIRLVVGTREGFACPSFETTPALKYEIALSTIDDAESAVDIAKEADPGMTKEKQDALVRYSGGFPLLIQVIANPGVSAAEIRELGIESLASAVGNEKISKVFQYFDGHLQEAERNALFSLSFANLAFDRGLVEKFIDGLLVDSLLRRPVFRKMSSTALYILPDIIGRYFIETYRSRYDGKSLNKIHQTNADYYRRVLDEVSTSKPSPQAWQKYLIINGSHLPGRMIQHVIYHYLEAKNYKKAREITVDYFYHLLDTGNALFLEPVLTMLKEKIKKPDAAVDYYLAKVSNKLYKYERSLELYLSLLDRVESKEYKAEVFYQLGMLYDNKQDFAEALQWYQKSADIFEEIGNKKGLASTYNALGIMYSNRSDYAESIRWCKRSAKIREEIGDRKGMASTYYQLGITYDALQDYASAFRWYEKSAAIFEEIGDLRGMADTYKQLGITYNKQQNYESAIQWYQKSAKIKLEIGDREGLALTYLNLGIISGQLQHYDEALQWYQKSSTISEEIGDRDSLAKTYNNLGGMYNHRQDYMAAIQWYKRSADIFEEISNKKNLAHTYQQLGMTYFNLKDYALALQWYEKSIDLMEKIGYKKGLVATYHQLGITYENKQEYSTALDWYDKSFALAKEIRDFQGMIFTLAQKSLLYFNMEKYPEALINILSAITFAEKDAPHLLKQAQDQLQYFYNQLGEEKAREILNAL